MNGPVPPALSILAACLAALSPALACAQSASPAAAPPPPAREGTAAIAYLGTTGNTSTQTIGLDGEVIVRPDKWVVRNRAAFLRNESDGTLTAESLQYVFRAERLLSARASTFGEYGYFRDQFAGLANHNEVTGGVSYKVVNRRAQVLSADGGLGYLDEHRLSGPDVSSGTYVGGAEFRWTISPTAEFSDTARFAGTFADARDWRLARTVALTARLTSLFSLKVSNTIRYAHAPVPGFKATDTNTAIALMAKF